MINKQNNIKVKETRKVKNLRRNPYNPSWAGNMVNISKISLLAEPTPRVRLFFSKYNDRVSLRNTKELTNDY